MANEIFGGFGSFGNIGTLLIYAAWFGLFLIIALSVTGIVLLILFKKTNAKIYEIGLFNHQLRMFHGRFKKNKHGIKQLWSRKINKWLPMPQQKDIYFQKKQETLLLVKDNNNLYHTARLPTYKELRKWYLVIHNLDITEEGTQEKLKDIYLLPNPHEDLDWLSSQTVEAKDEFGADHWWQHPNFMVIGTAFVCFLIIVVTIILEKKL